MKKTVEEAAKELSQRVNHNYYMVLVKPEPLQVVLDELSSLQSENNELRNTISKIKTDLPDEKIRELNPIWVLDEIVKRLTNK